MSEDKQEYTTVGSVNLLAAALAATAEASNIQRDRINELEDQLRQENARVLGEVSRFREALEEIVATEMESGYETDALYIAREALNGE